MLNSNSKIIICIFRVLAKLNIPPSLLNFISPRRKEYMVVGNRHLESDKCEFKFQLLFTLGFDFGEYTKLLQALLSLLLEIWKQSSSNDFERWHL